MDQPLSSMRLDKWLWVARFFKTRQFAIEAVKGGKVHLNGQRSKPGKDVKPGNHLRIHKGSLEWEIEVLGLAAQRRPATEAVLLYRESEESKMRRERILLERRRLRELGNKVGGPRPTKRERRHIDRFIESGD